MVFLSTLQAVLGRPLTRSVFAFGSRSLTASMVLQEVVMGFFLVFPLSILAAHLLLRWAAAGWRPWFVRPDLYTTFLITLMGDVFLEILLPSLQCLPENPPFYLSSSSMMDTDGLGYGTWLQQTWGFACHTGHQHATQDYDPYRSPNASASSASSALLLLTPDAVGTLLTVRLVFMCLGVYLGESFLPIALTGGIACGKSTVAKLLSDPKDYYSDNAAANHGNSNEWEDHGGPSNSASNHSKTKRKKKQQQQQHHQSDVASSFTTSSPNSDSEEEGSFLIVDTDSIGHQILLPPAYLEQESQKQLTNSSNSSSTTMLVHASDSVYPQVVQAFATTILDEQTGWIDRRKLGAVIFTDSARRRTLNKITHPRIILVLFKRLLYGIFGSSQDVCCADVPLLFESGQLRRLFCLVICVVCDPDIQLQRLQERNPDLSLQECKDRIASQMDLEKKKRMADIVIVNNGSPQELAVQVETARKEVMGRIYGIGMSLLQMLLLVGGSLSLAVSSKLFSSWS